MIQNELFVPCCLLPTDNDLKIPSLDLNMQPKFIEENIVIKCTWQFKYIFFAVVSYNTIIWELPLYCPMLTA